MKILRLIGNIAWFIFVGLELFIGELVACALSIVLIVPIFFGIPKVHFRLAQFVVAPFGKRVKIHFMRAPIRNVASLILGGFLSAGYAIFAGFLLCCTVVGIPLGITLFQVAKFEFAPFHAVVTSK